MNALKMPLFWVYALPFVLLSAISCVPSATTMHHSGSFSNIRSEILMNDGSVLRGYASMNSMKGEDALRVRVQGEKTERMIPLSAIDKLMAEEHEFVVKWLETPNRAIREGKSAKVRAMVKRLGMEADPVQIFEYKYAVSNPKSPISNTMTAFFVSFPDDPADLPLCELNSAAYKQKWATLLARNENNAVVSTKAPSSVKSLIEQVKKLEISPEEAGMQNFGAAE
jgi:hypothetical protein